MLYFLSPTSLDFLANISSKQNSAVYQNILRGGILAEFKSALTEISSALGEICRFWKSTSLAIENYITGGYRNNAITAARHLARRWEAYETASKSTIMSLAKSSDAFVVDPIGVSSLAVSKDPTTNYWRYVGSWLTSFECGERLMPTLSIGRSKKSHREKSDY